MGDIKNGSMNDVLDSISNNLKGYAENVYGDYSSEREIKSVIDEIQNNLEKTKYTVNEQEYEDKIREIAEKLNDKNKAIEDNTSFGEMILGVKKDVSKEYEQLKKGYEHLEEEKSSSSSKTKKKSEKKKTNRLMPTKKEKEKRTTLKQKIALFLKGGLIAKIPFVKEFIDKQLKPLNSGKTKSVSSKGKRNKMLESLGFKGVSHSKAKANAEKSKTRNAQKSQGR